MLYNFSILELFDHWKRDAESRSCRYNYATERNYLVDFARHVEVHHGAQFPCTEILPVTLRTWAAGPTDNPNTIRGRMTSVRRVLRFAYDTGLIDFPKLYNAKLPPAVRRRRDVLTKEELSAIAASLSDPRTKIIIKDRLIFNLLLLGLRSAEIRSLRWIDLSSDKRSFTATIKGGSTRTYPIGRDLYDRLLDWKRYCKSPFIIADRVDTPAGLVPSESLLQSIRRILKRAGIERRNYTGPHLFRHSIATLLFDSTDDLKRVQNFLGHRNAATTEIYLHTGGTDVPLADVEEIHKAIRKKGGDEDGNN